MSHPSVGIEQGHNTTASHQAAIPAEGMLVESLPAAVELVTESVVMPANLGTYEVNFDVIAAPEQSPTDHLDAPAPAEPKPKRQEEALTSREQELNDRFLTSQDPEISKRAFGELFTLYRPTLARLKGMNSLSEQQRDDMLSDVFESVWRRIGDAKDNFTDQGRGVLPYLVRSTANRMASHWRKGNHEVTSDPQVYSFEDALPTTNDSETYVNDESINDALGALALESEIPDAAELIVAIVFQGMTYKQYAEVKGVPVGTVGSRYLRARKALAPILERMMHEGAF